MSADIGTINILFVIGFFFEPIVKSIYCTTQVAYQFVCNNGGYDDNTIDTPHKRALK